MILLQDTIPGAGLTLRFATSSDTADVLSLIKELAAYEHMESEVSATEEILDEFLFKRKHAEAVIGECDGKTVGFALFFHNFSTFLGRPGIYLEDLYVKPAFRGMGFGKTFLRFLAKLALERGCGRLEWSCLDWNKPSIGFYRHIGAQPMDEWTVYRVTGAGLRKLAESCHSDRGKS